MIVFTLIAKGMEHSMMGPIPLFFSEGLPIPAEDQMRAGYRATAGCSPGEVFNRQPQTMQITDDGSLKYPGDPLMRPLAEFKLGSEMLRFYDYSMFSIQQPDGSFKAWRLD